MNVPLKTAADIGAGVDRYFQQKYTTDDIKIDRTTGISNKGMLIAAGKGLKGSWQDLKTGKETSLLTLDKLERGHKYKKRF